jgi:hypothetical protein
LLGFKRDLKRRGFIFLSAKYARNYSGIIIHEAAHLAVILETAGFEDLVMLDAKTQRHPRPCAPMMTL